MKKVQIEALVYFAGANAEAFKTDRSKSGNLWKRCIVAFRYMDKDGKTTNRIAEPRRVFQTGRGEQMLLAWCPVGREWRAFKCDSITDIRIGGIGKQREPMTTETNLPQKTMDSVEAILGNVKVYAQLKYLAGMNEMNRQNYKRPDSSFVNLNEDAESCLRGIKKSLFDVLDDVFKAGFDEGIATGSSE